MATAPARRGRLAARVLGLLAVAALAVLDPGGNGAAFAQDDVEIRARVDRTTPRLNESFTYVLTAEGRVRGEPDIEPLTELFDVLRSQESTRIQIVNGRAEQVAEWVYLLMPLHEGKALIPPIEVAGRFSNPVEIEVLAPDARADAPGEIFLEADVSHERAYVQSQIVYTLRLFVGTTTGRAAITAPEIVDGEAVVERLGDDTEYRASRGGREFTVRERRYAIFPQRAGTLTIGRATFEAMIIPPRGFSRVQRFSSDPVEVEVLAAVPPPASHPDAAWLPARRLTLTEQWGGGAGAASDLVVGVPATRSLTIEAEGLLETQLPELAPPRASGVRLYADRPELSRAAGADGFVSSRVERYAVLPQSAGDAMLPGVELPWFDVEAERWQVASVPAQTLEVMPGDEPAAVPMPTEEPAASAERPAPVPSGAGAGPWPVVSAVLALGWALTGLLWWRSRRSARSARPAGEREAARPRAGAALKRVRAACERNDPAAARDTLLEWAEERFPDAPPRSLGALAARLPSAPAGAVRDLEAALYAPGPGGWDGAPLAAALRLEAASADRGGRRRGDPLVPLYR